MTADVNSMFVLEEWRVEKWSLWFLPTFCAAIMIGLEILARIIPVIFTAAGSNLIAVKGYHLDKFSSIDNAFIFINKLLTILFVYHFLLVTNNCTTIVWGSENLSVANTIGSMIAFYVIYDFFYMNFHRVLHFRSLYAYIHKHHHRQKAPSRGNLDAINVHPFEFVVGEYLHLLTIYVIPCHIYTAIAFVLLGGIFASLNHTRFDVNIPWIYSVKAHDVHHRLPESNYGQYTMLWDHLFHTFRPYDKNNKESE